MAEIINNNYLGAVPNIVNASQTTGGATSNMQISDGKTWDSFVTAQIENLIKSYDVRNTNGIPNINSILTKWHQQITTDYKHDTNFTPHVSGFYMIFMVHGTWYNKYQSYVKGGNEAGLSTPLTGGSGQKVVSFKNPTGYFNMLATDIDIPDITEEYISVSSRIRNSFMPSRNYFVSDFTISYIENINLDIMRYHEAWHKFMNLVKRGEITDIIDDCEKSSSGYFMEVPYSNAVWVAVFKPFTTDIQLLIKLVGVMPVTMPLKQVIGNRSQSKMTVLNISYKAADIFYKFYKDTNELLGDDGELAKAFQSEVMHPSDGAPTTSNINSSGNNSIVQAAINAGNTAFANLTTGIPGF